MYRVWTKWGGLLLLMATLPISAISSEEDAGPMPPPDGPFFSSKPLLYYGEDPLTDTAEIIQQPDSPVLSEPLPPVWLGNPAQGYPNYYGPAPFGFGNRMMPLPQMSPYPPRWGVQPPYYPYNPNYLGYPPFPGRAGVAPR